jgi:hypothetical protein
MLVGNGVLWRLSMGKEGSGTIGRERERERERERDFSNYKPNMNKRKRR